MSVRASTPSSSFGYVSAEDIPGVERLWAETVGDPHICIAILDGPVELSHESLAAADLTRLPSLAVGASERGPAARHGSHVASVVFGQHEGPVKGIAPRSHGLIVPIFTDGADGSLAPCSQLDLARAILQAAQHGAHVINVSSGQLAPAGEAHPFLAHAVRHCADNNILVVAAAGNEGCDCLHVPGALPSVLAVGAMDSHGVPLGFSNWGERYRAQGILAPGENIVGASLDGGTVVNSGTSYATPIVSGIAALLLSLQRKYGQHPDPRAVRAAILSSAAGCDDMVSNCRRLLGGRLRVDLARAHLLRGGSVVADSVEGQVTAPMRERSSGMEVEGHPVATVESPASAQFPEWVGGGVDHIEGSSPPTAPSSAPFRLIDRPAGEEAILPSHEDAAGCGCGGGGISACTCGGGKTCTCNAATSVQPRQLVYALGQIGFDFGTEARRSSISQHMDGHSPYDSHQLLSYLEANPWDASSIGWTLNLEATPIYAIRPQGAFAEAGYNRLRQFLREQATEGVERVSVAGFITGRARLMSGQLVPTIQPNLRCMYSWTTGALVEAVSGKPPPESAKDKEKELYTQRTEAVRNFLERVYHDLRNLGITPQERAVNYAATNALNADRIFEATLREDMQLDTVEVERSPICRPDSECWEVKLTFFNPRSQLEQARKVYRFTCDVSDVCPVIVGNVRSWFVR